ncbi:MAG: thiopurine S-methyltransferase [Pseudomonadota bacterium]
MKEQFWQNRWESGRIAFHEGTPNEFLEMHLGDLALSPGSHVFVPLCGKAYDLDWLLEQGHRVTGIEFNRDAVEEVFERRSLFPVVKQHSGLRRLSSGQLTLWQGDFFSLQATDLGDVDAIYDRAALVALPDPLRKDYAIRLSELTKSAPQLLISFSYDQSQTEGPPFSVPEQAIRQLYGSTYDIDLLSSEEITGPLADRCVGQEQTWKLIPKIRQGA